MIRRMFVIIGWMLLSVSRLLVMKLVEFVRKCVVMIVGRKRLIEVFIRMVR